MKATVIQVGKRKTAVAKAYIREGSGRVRINRRPLEILTPELARLTIMEPFYVAAEWAKERGLPPPHESLDIDVDVRGGGFMGQACAARTAISKGLVAWYGDDSLRAAMLRYDRRLLMDDVRFKERKMFGGRGSRKRRQTSYR